MAVAVISLDLKGGLNNIHVDLLLDLLVVREYVAAVILWVKR